MSGAVLNDILFIPLRETQKSISDWAVSTFGPSGSDLNVFDKAKEEFEELERELRSPGDHRAEAALEIADVFIVLYRLADRLGYDIHDVIDAKMQVNRSRKWDLKTNHHIE